MAVHPHWQYASLAWLLVLRWQSMAACSEEYLAWQIVCVCISAHLQALHATSHVRGRSLRIVQRSSRIGQLSLRRIALPPWLCGLRGCCGLQASVFCLQSAVQPHPGLLLRRRLRLQLGLGCMSIAATGMQSIVEEIEVQLVAQLLGWHAQGNFATKCHVDTLAPMNKSQNLQRYRQQYKCHYVRPGKLSIMCFLGKLCVSYGPQCNEKSV